MVNTLIKKKEKSKNIAIKIKTCNFPAQTIFLITNHLFFIMTNETQAVVGAVVGFKQLFSISEIQSK